MTRSIPYLLIALAVFTCTPWAASADDIRFFSSSSQSSCSAQLGRDGLQLKMVRTPLGDALNLIGNTYGVEVLVDATAYRKLAVPVSASGKNLTFAETMQQVLSDAKLASMVDAERRVIVSGEPVTAACLDELELVSLRALAVERALQKRVPMMLFHTPLEMGLQMAEGFAGISIRIDEAAFRQAGIDAYQPVSLQSNNVPLAESLNRLLKPLGLDYVASGTGIVVTTKAVAAAVNR